MLHTILTPYAVAMRDAPAREWRSHDARQNLLLDRLLARYIDGWAEANAAKIAEAVSPDYDFLDPLVGSFDRNSLRDYFCILRDRVGFNKVQSQQRKVCLGAFPAAHGPGPRLRFWRSLPECGLAGTSELELTAGRVSREVVCYEPNIATERLRGRPCEEAKTQVSSPACTILPPYRPERAEATWHPIWARPDARVARVTGL